jgi:ribosomal protein S18 acetylase RimI-like enzyme
MTVDIREAVPGDAPGIAAVAERVWYEVHAPIIGEDRTAEFLETYYDEASLRDVIDRDRWVTYVADAGEIVGFVSGGPSDDDPDLFHLNRIYLRPEHRGEGIGGQLLDTFERDAAALGYDRVSLRVMADNEQSVRFYEATGFDRHDELFDETVGTDAYVYVKKL